MSESQNTAILFFTRSAEVEHQVKNLRLSKKSGRKMFELFNATTLQKACQTGLPVVEWKEELQQGKTFGQRLSHAVENVFNKGFENVVIIGNDCPELRTSEILEAAKNLQNGKVALGPDKDGGTFLIGLSKDTFKKKKFESLPWQTERLLGATISYFEDQQKPISFLKQKFDVDSSAVLRMIASTGKLIRSFREKILSLLIDHWIKGNNIRSCQLAEPYYPAHSLRGPPSK